MKYIDKLLQGAPVEWKTLGEVADIVDGFAIKAKEIQDHGEYAVIKIGNIINGKIVEQKNYLATLPQKVKTSQILTGGEILVGLSGSTGKTGYNSLKKAIVNQRISIIRNRDSIILNGFLKHLLINPAFEQHCFRLGTGPQNNLSKGDLCAYPIPIPPLAVQEEVVRVLDTFTTLEAELEAELDCRKRQYEYYRDALLTFDLSHTPLKTIDDVCLKISSGGTPNTAEKAYYEGDIPWLRTQDVNWLDVYETDVKISEAAIENSSAKIIPANCVIVAMYGATAAKVCINRIPLATNQACCNLQVNDEVANYKYVYYWLCHEYEKLKAKGEGSQSNLNMKKIKSYPIPIPPLAVQEQIVEMLDKFDTLVHSISEGLPREIALRRKQYEYYRDALLTF